MENDFEKVPDMTMNQVQDAIIQKFSGLNDWLDKYEYLIKLGGRVQGFDETLRTDAFAVSGCQSQLWVRTQIIDGRIRWSADSDSQITKGILSLILSVVNNRLPEEIVESDLYFIPRIGLEDHLSPQRKNGLAVMVRHIKSEVIRLEQNK